MVAPTVQAPTAYNVIGSDGKITPQWYFFFQQYKAALPPSGSGYVVDGSLGTFGPTTIFQGIESSMPPSPSTGYVFIALDTGNIYVSSSGAWVKETPAFTGDVTKPIHSNVLTLATVNPVPGTFGDVANYPVITVDGKGRVTNVSLQPTTSGGSGGPVGPNGSVQFNNGGVFAGVPTLSYASGPNRLTLTNEQVLGQITFANPIPTRTNLLPVQTGKAGMVLATNGTDVFWESPGPYEFVFHYGDATPSPLMTIPAGKTILSCSIIITQAFNGIGASLSIGKSASYNDVMATSDNIPGELSTWQTAPNIVYGVNTPISLSITPGAGATAGAGIVTITVQQ